MIKMAIRHAIIDHFKEEGEKHLQKNVQNKRTYLIDKNDFQY